MSSLGSLAVSPVLEGAISAATTSHLHWKQSTQPFFCRFTLPFFHNTVLVFTYEHAHCNAIIGGRAHCNEIIGGRARFNRGRVLFEDMQY